MLIRHLFTLLLLLPLFWGCDKEPLSPDDAVPGSALIGERSGPSQAEIQEALVAIDSIKAFKEQIDRWRDGQELSKSMDAGQAAEQVETAINLYISKPGQAYEDYTTVVDSVSVPTSSSTWSGAQIAAFFNAMKGRLVHHFSQVSGTDKAYQFVDMGAPVVDGGSSKVYFRANIGTGSVTEMPTGGSNATDCNCDILGVVKWSVLNSSDPNASISCTGRANEIIGIGANQEIGFVMRNLAPSIVNPATNNPLRSDVRILSPFESVATNFLGNANPFGGPPPIIVVNIRERTPEWAFPFLDNEINECNQSPDFKTLGQYAVHVDTTGNFNLEPSDIGYRYPDENCFCIVPKVFNYIDRNVEAGRFYAPWVNQAVFPNNPPSIFLQRRLVSTVVGPNRQSAAINESNVLIELQEHPTVHLYAAFTLLPEVVIGPIVTPLEL